MIISNIYLIIAGQVAIIMVFLIGYLITMLVSEENRWEEYTEKLKNKIRELLDYKDRFDIVSENLHKQMEITKELSEKVAQFDSLLEAKDSKIGEQANFINELQNIIKGLEEKANLLDATNITITELRTQLALLEDQGTEYPEIINDLNITIDSLETKNNSLKIELNSANKSLAVYQQDPSNIRNDDFNLSIDGTKNDLNDNVELINNLQARHQSEIDREKKSNKNNENIIDDLESALMEARNNPSQPLDLDPEILINLKQMLSESSTVVEMLEGELDTLQDKINQLEAQNKTLSDSIEKSQTEEPALPEVTFNDSTEDDVFFEDTSSEPVASEKDKSEEIFYDVEPASDDVFFDQDDATVSSSQDANKDSVSSEELEQLQMQLDGANQMAMTMMMTSGDQGNVINFARNSIKYETLEDLGTGILETVALFQVNGALQIRGDEHEPINLSTYGPLTEKDTDKITHDKNLDIERFVENDAELLIQFENISLLINDMPVSDADKMGRIKDNMAIALELACSNLRSIESAMTIKKNQKILNQVLKNTYETIQNVEQQFNEQSEVTNQVINSLTGIISNPAMTKGMDPIYKDVFTSIISDGRAKFDDIKEKGVAIDVNFAEIVRRLGSKINN